MSDSPLRIVTSQPADNGEPAGSTPVQDEAARDEPRRDEMGDLRRLLIGPEQTQIINILERLNNPRVRSRELSRSLPEAIRLRASQDESLKEALAPTIVSAFHNSIRKDPRPIAEAISPLMGPAIRRAISNALSSLVQSLDQTLKHSFSWQGLKWRLEALRSGKSFAEVVLYHTLVYRVEQVFLIDKHSGLLLQHVAADRVAAHDADLVSGMLTAIQEAIRSFARDSFGSGQDQHVDKLDLGDLEVWFETGPRAVLAVVLRGNAPETLRGDFFIPAIEAIHLEMREHLESFDGDTSPFEVVRPHLESCLQSRYQAQAAEERYRVPFYIWLFCGLVLLALASWAAFSWRAQYRWTKYLNRIEAEPGLIVTESGKLNGKRYVAGLRDPLAADPDEILRRESLINPNSVISRWEPYQALEPRFILARARTLLEPPPGVDLKFENGILSASGAASHDWISEARKYARVLPGVLRFNDDQLADEDLKEPEALRRQIQQCVIRFVVGTTELVPGQSQALRDLTLDLQRLISIAPSAGRTVEIHLIGHTDTEGDETTNLQLSRDRASRMLALLTARGVEQNSLTFTGVGSSEPVRPETSQIDKQFNRSVSFKVSLLDQKPRPLRPYHPSHPSRSAEGRR